MGSTQHQIYGVSFLLDRFYYFHVGLPSPRSFNARYFFYFLFIISYFYTLFVLHKVFYRDLEHCASENFYVQSDNLSEFLFFFKVLPCWNAACRYHRNWRKFVFGYRVIRRWRFPFSIRNVRNKKVCSERCWARYN